MKLEMEDVSLPHQAVMFSNCKRRLFALNLEFDYEAIIIEAKISSALENAHSISQKQTGALASILDFITIFFF